MGFIRTEEEVDTMIADMISKTKGNYITQGVSFNKNSARQLELLKMVLMRSNSFSGFIKELLAEVEVEDGMVKIPVKSLMNNMGGVQIRETHTSSGWGFEVEEPIGVGNFI